MEKSLAYAIVGLLIIVILGALYYFTLPQKPVFDVTAPRTIGFIEVPQNVVVYQGFQAGLKALGYTNITYDHFMSTPNQEARPKALEAAKAMITRGDNILVATSELEARAEVDAVKDSGKNIPIVFMSRLHDPIQAGLVTSLEHPGDNVTGVSTNMQDVAARTLQFLLQVNPNIKKVGIFGKGFIIPEIGGALFDVYKQEAAKLGLQIVEYTTNVPPPQAESDFNRIAATIKPGDIDALIHIPGHFYLAQQVGEYALAKRLGIPHAVPTNDLPDGGDFSYADDLFASGQQLAPIVDKIFRGANPGDIPVAYAANNKLYINPGRFAESGLTIPETMLYIGVDVTATGTTAQLQD